MTFFTAVVTLLGHTALALECAAASAVGLGMGRRLVEDRRRGDWVPATENLSLGLLLRAAPGGWLITRLL
jgi:hypothetical protein